MSDIHQRETKKKLIIGLIALAILSYYNYAKAEPPHPRLHYKWESLPGQQVVLYFYEGKETRYIYQLEHEAEPARPCAPQYNETTFRLVTWDVAQPYYYVIKNKPTMVWDDGKRSFIRLD